VSQTSDSRRRPGSELDAYLDGILTAEERGRFEARLAADPALAEEVQTQRRIDGSLARIFAEPDDFSLPSRGRAIGPAPRSIPAWQRWAIVGLAAAILMTVLGVYLPSMVGPGAPPRHRIEVSRLYQAKVEGGFIPDEVCTSDEQFAAWVKERFGEPLAPSGHPEAVQYVGWSYARVMSDYTGVLLARVEGRPVLVLLDRADRATTAPARPGRGLSLHRAQVGNLILYEVTPLREARVLPLLRPSHSRGSGCSPAQI
jgi:hypothetical protein